MAFLESFLALFLESAPWLLLGLVIAGLIKMFVPMAWMNKQLGGNGIGATIKAAIFGAPLPLCSCGVIPAAVGLRRSGASKAATTSFLISTPETGVDSISISYVLLGPFMAIVRPIAAILSAITAGILVGDDPKEEKESKSYSFTAAKPASSPLAQARTSVSALNITQTKINPKASASSCCSSASSTCSSSSAKTNSSCGAEDASCCGSEVDTESLNFVQKIKKGLHFAATELIDDTALWLLVGLGFAALVDAYVPDGFFTEWGQGIVAMLVMVVISIPMYICATASTPIAAGLLLAGVSPGAVLVFMLAGPASNIASLGVVYKELGKRALFGYLAGVMGVALISGFVVNYLVANFGFQVTPQIGEEFELLPHWLIITCGIGLTVLIINSIVKKIAKRSHKHALTN